MPLHLDMRALVECGEDQVRHALLETCRSLVVQLHQDGRTRERAKGAVAELQGRLYLMLKSKRLADEITTLIYTEFRHPRAAS